MLNEDADHRKHFTKILTSAIFVPPLGASKGSQQWSDKCLLSPALQRSDQVICLL